MKVLVVIPAYNEEKMVGNVVTEVKSLGYNVVVVDDGSKDETAKIAKRSGAVVLRHFVNLGQGAAIQTGFDYAKMQNADIVVTYDADGQLIARDIEKVIKPLLLGEYDIVLGSRYLDAKSNVPFIKKYIVHKGAMFFEQIFVGLKLSDAHNAFRALSKKAFNKINIKQNQMAHATEFIEEIKKHKLKYFEVPVTVKYTEYSKSRGQSVFNSIRIIYDLLLSRVLNKK